MKNGNTGNETFGKFVVLGTAKVIFRPAGRLYFYQKLLKP